LEHCYEDVTVAPEEGVLSATGVFEHCYEDVTVAPEDVDYLADYRSVRGGFVGVEQAGDGFAAVDGEDGLGEEAGDGDDLAVGG
jgi:hypothetical protein